MKVQRRFGAVAAGLLASLAAACGGDTVSTPSDAADQASPAVTAGSAVTTPTTADSSAPASSAPTVVVPAPNATLAPDLPAVVDGQVGPVEIVGSPLPELGEAQVADDPAVGAVAPVLVGLDDGGAPVRVDGTLDGPTMLVFVAHWCPHCNAELPRINQLRDEGRVPAGLRVVAVSTAVAPDRPNFPATTWIRETMDWTYPVILDGVDVERGAFLAADAFGVDSFPFVVLVGGDGKVAARWAGESDPDEILERIGTYLAL